MLTRPLAHSPKGFTLTELLIVMIIVTIIAGLALAALVGALGGSRESNTRALIKKLDRGLNDRLDTWRSQSFTVLPIDQSLADDGTADTVAISQRSQIIARKRLLKEQFPQWFTVLKDASGNLIRDSSNKPIVVGDWDPLWVDFDGDGVPDFGTIEVQVPAAMSPISQAYRTHIDAILAPARDGIDNDNDGTIDEDDETPLFNHDPRTTWAECLYMILTMGPGSSAVDPAEFPHREVRDTDGDGLPELLDGWNNPIRFYRWPFLYQSQLQKGVAGYDNTKVPPEAREDDSLDPNRILVSATWWGAAASPGPNRLGFEFATSVASGATGTEPLLPLAFHTLTDVFGPSPFFAGDRCQAWNVIPDSAVGCVSWLPNTAYGDWARAYKATPLIVSAGPDGLFGIQTPAPSGSGLENPEHPTMGDPNIDRSIRAGALTITREYWDNRLQFVPGYAGSGVEEQIDAYLDNITNHGVRSDQ